MIRTLSFAFAIDIGLVRFKTSIAERGFGSSVFAEETLAGLEVALGAVDQVFGVGAGLQTEAGARVALEAGGARGAAAPIERVVRLAAAAHVRPRARLAAWHPAREVAAAVDQVVARQSITSIAVFWGIGTALHAGVAEASFARGAGRRAPDAGSFAG